VVIPTSLATDPFLDADFDPFLDPAFDPLFDAALDAFLEADLDTFFDPILDPFLEDLVSLGSISPSVWSAYFALWILVTLTDWLAYDCNFSTYILKLSALSSFGLQDISLGLKI
jgi:hypothetical protein